MLRILALFGVFLFMSCVKKDKVEPSVTEKIDSTAKIQVVNFEGLQKVLKNENSDTKTLVVNFWATWCKPCVEEMPHFEALQDSLGGENFEVILVSLDFPKHLDSQVYPFVKKKELQSRVILLDDPHENEWIPKVDNNWSGAIPATLILKGQKRVFYENSFTRESLFEAIENFKNDKL